MIHQCEPPIFVYTPHGPALCLFIIDYGININTHWVCALKENNKIKHYDANDIRLAENYTIGVKTPEIPKPGEDGY
jgi:hypothetical protein